MKKGKGMNINSHPELDGSLMVPVDAEYHLRTGRVSWAIALGRHDIQHAVSTGGAVILKVVLVLHSSIVVAGHPSRSAPSDTSTFSLAALSAPSTSTPLLLATVTLRHLIIAEPSLKNLSVAINGMVVPLFLAGSALAAKVQVPWMGPSEAVCFNPADDASRWERFAGKIHPGNVVFEALLIHETRFADRLHCHIDQHNPTEASYCGVIGMSQILENADEFGRGAVHGILHYVQQSNDTTS
jgi:hypothetical protein